MKCSVSLSAVFSAPGSGFTLQRVRAGLRWRSRCRALYHSNAVPPCFVRRDMQLWYQLRAEELERMQEAYFGFKGRNSNNNNGKLRTKSVFVDVTNVAYDNQGYR